MSEKMARLEQIPTTGLRALAIISPFLYADGVQVQADAGHGVNGAAGVAGAADGSIDDEAGIDDTALPQDCDLDEEVCVLALCARVHVLYNALIRIDSTS
jgi:hypothetical protein